MLSASIWKYIADDDGDIYRMQVNNIDNNTLPVVESSLEDWQNCGEGWNSDGIILFFRKKFNDPDDVERWAEKFKQFSLKILDRKGNAKKEIKAEVALPEVKISKRVCSKCKQSGHNAATCRNFHRKEVTAQVVVPSVTIVEEKGKRTCSKCKQKGHNARSCKYK